jgi:hypothetical protein
MAEGEPGAVDLTEAGGGTRDFGNQRGLTKAHLAEALAEILVALDFANSPRCASGKLAEGEKRWAD